MVRSQPRATDGIKGAHAARGQTKGVQDDPKSRNDNAGKMPTVIHTGRNGWSVEASPASGCRSEPRPHDRGLIREEVIVMPVRTASWE